MRFALCLLASFLAGCALQPPAESPPPKRVDPTVSNDYRIVPRAPDVVSYPALAEHVWVPPSSGRVFVVVKVTNHPPVKRELPKVAIIPPAPAPVQQQRASVSPPISEYTVELHFGFDKSVLDTSGRASLDKLASQLGKTGFAEAEFYVEGHTDSRGSDTYNQRLSEQRARVVRDYLVSKGASSARVAVRGIGEAKPVQSNDTEAGRAANRRVIVNANSNGN